jgi:hypothetical protein
MASSVIAAVITAPSSMWVPSNNKNNKPHNYHYHYAQSYSNFPEDLASKQLDQINKIYNTCIYPTQYLPIQFNQANTTLILQTGHHASETMKLSGLQCWDQITSNLASLHKAYPLLVRTTSITHFSTQVITTTNKILSTSYTDNDIAKNEAFSTSMNKFFLRNKTERRRERVYLKIGKKTTKREGRGTWIISLFACRILSPLPSSHPIIHLYCCLHSQMQEMR